MPTVIVTGASGNLGKAVAEKFLQEGYDVIGTVMHDSAAIAHPAYTEFAIDLSKEDEVERFVDDAVKKFSTIDAAVLTAGGFAMGKLADTSVSDLLTQYTLNFQTAYILTRAIFVKMMSQGSGRIFLIGSRPGLDMKASKGSVAYGLSKSLLFRLAEIINEDGKEHNVVAAVVVPSTLDTPQNRKSMPDVDPGKWVKAGEIAEVIHFYCTKEATALREPVIKLYGNS
jgi:NAD(P)-dependent dehydrogenase (short-subunit alcohol dehydrogenase family)